MNFTLSRDYTTSRVNHDNDSVELRVGRLLLTPG